MIGICWLMLIYNILLHQKKITYNRLTDLPSRSRVSKLVGDTGSPSPVISDACTPSKPRTIKKKNKNNPVYQTPTQPKWNLNRSNPNRSSSYRPRATWAATVAFSETTSSSSIGTASFRMSASPTHPSIASVRIFVGTPTLALHANIDAMKVCGLGPGMAFNNVVREHAGAVGLVPCPVGGTAIKEWTRGEHLNESMVKRERESVRGGVEIKGLLWYQGESGVSTQHDADAYHENMVKLIENVREDLCLPSLPIIQVAIGSRNAKYM